MLALLLPRPSLGRRRDTGLPGHRSRSPLEVTAQGDGWGGRGRVGDSIRDHRGDVELVELDLHINDEAFAVAAAEKLLALIGAAESSA